MEMCMLTTTDNPYDPFTQYEAWYRFDEDNGYHSCAFLARIARTSDQLSDKENPGRNRASNQRYHQVRPPGHL